ncbi:AraC family transcriptional regulator [Streptomyces sp. NPDC006134]|uniref:AraC family transcriptional regulator n=1 Tax=Streptomyces sp. NPDC006134 TaxID=3154467 RepID=UPI00340283D2
MGPTPPPATTTDAHLPASAPDAARAEVLLPAPALGAGRTDTRRLGFLQVGTVSGPPQSLRLAPAGGAPHLVVGVHARGRARLVRHGTDGLCRPGDLFVRDGSDPLVLHETEDFELHLVRIPLRALPLTESQVHGLTRRRPHAGGAVAPLLARLLRTLAGTATAGSARTELHVAGNVAELVAALAVEDAGPEPPGSGQDRVALVRRLRAHIDENLWDRGLSPAVVAAAHHVSIRYLHKLFSGHGSTVGRWIQHRRLEEARRELARPGRSATSVSAVAARWGFSGAAHFSRSFRLAYGMSPTDWREARTAPSRHGTG